MTDFGLWLERARECAPDEALKLWDLFRLVDAWFPGRYTDDQRVVVQRTVLSVAAEEWMIH